jgi:uncharacterized RDD family membrane protein YckC
MPEISGFWRRFAAFAIDVLLLGLAGQVLVWSFSSFWFRMGPYGRIVGALIALGYFGVMGSRAGAGATVGKRILGIAVRDAADRPIGIGRSMARTLIWLVPAILNGWSIPILGNHVVAWLASAVIFGIGGAVLFTMIFNHRTRQGLHDMVCGTYVVRVRVPGIEALPAVSRFYWKASAIIFVAGILLPGVGLLFFTSTSGGTLGQMLRLREDLAHDARFFSVNVLDQTFMNGSNHRTHTLRIDAWYKGRPSEAVRDEARKAIAKIALESVDGIERYDQMLISITSAYDLGITAGHWTDSDGQTIPTWRERVGSPASRSVRAP